MSRSESEWVQGGVAPRLRDRLAATSLPRLLPALLALAVIVTLRASAGNDFGPLTLLRDTGRSVALSVDYQRSVLSLAGKPRCEELVRTDTGTHTAAGVGLLVQNRVDTGIRLVEVFEVWSGGSHRTVLSFLPLHGHVSTRDFRLLAPPAFAGQKVPDVEPIEPGITQCLLLLRLVPTLSTLSSPAEVSPACRTAFDALDANYNTPEEGARSNDTVRNCSTPDEWIAVAAQHSVFVVGQTFATPTLLNEELFLWCLDPDRKLAETSICQAMNARSDRLAAALSAP